MSNSKSVHARIRRDPVRKAFRLVQRTVRRSIASSSIHRSIVSRLVLGEGEMSLLEIRKLLELVRDSDPTRPIVEIGSLFGSTALAMASVKPPTQRLICVDNFSWNPYGWDPTFHEQLTRRRLAPAMAHLAVEMITIDRRTFYQTYVGPPPALVFLDADHSYEATLEDIRWAQSVDADIICGDDYGAQFPGVVQAVQDAGGAVEVVDELFVMRNSNVTSTHTGQHIEDSVENQGA